MCLGRHELWKIPKTEPLGLSWQSRQLPPKHLPFCHARHTQGLVRTPLHHGISSGAQQCRAKYGYHYCKLHIRA